MVRENMRSPRAELHSILSRKKTSGVSFLGSTPGLRLVLSNTRGISSNGRAVASHATGKGIDAPILHSVRVAHEHEPPFPGLVSSVGRAHDSYDLRRSHERRRLLRSCGRGFNPRIGCKEFSSWLCGHTTLHEPECRERMPGRPGFESRRGRQTSTLLLTLSLVV